MSEALRWAETTINSWPEWVRIVAYLGFMGAIWFVAFAVVEWLDLEVVQGWLVRRYTKRRVDALLSKKDEEARPAARF